MKIKQKSKDLDTFVQAILSGKLKVGEIVRQSELCQILETSISPLRDTLVLLEELDLIEVKARAGIKVIYPDLEFMRDNMQFRILIEKGAIEIFAQVVSDDWIETQIKEHQDTLQMLEKSQNSEEHNAFVLDFDRAFHRTIVSAMKNTAITKAHEHIQTKLRIARQVHRRVPPKQINIRVMHDHLAILNALKARNLDQIHKALDEHFTASSHNTLVGY